VTTYDERPEVSKALPITGCSTGIGHAIALRLATSGRRGFVTTRRREPMADLAAQGCKTLQLDVDSDDSMQAAVQAAEGAVGELIFRTLQLQFSLILTSSFCSLPSVQASFLTLLKKERARRNHATGADFYGVRAYFAAGFWPSLRLLTAMSA
jgi:NAD(P)-dependent dehydrogenase (short-subunit alcohol dehydrogenase family)